MTQHTRQRYNYAIAQEVHKANFEKQLKAQPEKALIAIPFKQPLDIHHEAQPAPVTQPSIYTELQHLDIRERRKVIIERMGYGGRGIGVFKPCADKNKKK